MLERVQTFERKTDNRQVTSYFCGLEYRELGNPNHVTLYSLDCSHKVEGNAKAAVVPIQAFLEDSSQKSLSFIFYPIVAAIGVLIGLTLVAGAFGSEETP